MSMSQVFTELLQNVPDYKEFLTVNELDASSRRLAVQYPDVVSLFEIGKTRAGHPLLCLKIGSGSKNALMFGCPHPNEPIGTMMLEYFSENLAKSKALRDELDYTWYIVKAWDADGLRLNENWLKGPYTLYNYSRNFFRPAGFQQVDWRKRNWVTYVERLSVLFGCCPPLHVFFMDRQDKFPVNEVTLSQEFC